jgi:hypothetical protein
VISWKAIRSMRMTDMPHMIYDLHSLIALDISTWQYPHQTSRSRLPSGKKQRRTEEIQVAVVSILSMFFSEEYEHGRLSTQHR